MSDRAVALLLLVTAGAGLFLASERPSWLVGSLMLRLALIFVVGAVVYYAFAFVVMHWPRGLQGYALFCSLFVLGFGILIPMMPELGRRQAQTAHEWYVKATALRKFKAKVPKTHEVQCTKPAWDADTTTCQYVSKTDASKFGCFKNGAEQPDEVCVSKK